MGNEKKEEQRTMELIESANNMSTNDLMMVDAYWKALEWGYSISFGADECMAKWAKARADLLEGILYERDDFKDGTKVKTYIPTTWMGAKGNLPCFGIPCFTLKQAKKDLKCIDEIGNGFIAIKEFTL